MKIRLDQLVFERGFADSREAAKRLILTGKIFVNDQRADKAGRSYPSDCRVELKGKKCPYVGRGGYKLAGALDELGLEVKPGALGLDIGASTGGFTDCLLQRGAGEVVAVDVGRGQLHEKLRQDPRVKSLERTNARNLTLGVIGGRRVDWIVIDVSFISLRLILPPCRGVIAEDGQLIALVKPQFEAGKGKVASGGIVRDPAVHEEVLREILGFARSDGWTPEGLTRSSIKGADGNVEFLLYLRPWGRPDASDASAETAEQADAEAIRRVLEVS